MLINYKNLEYVNDVQVHDAAFKGFVYDFSKKLISFTVKNYSQSKKTLTVCFNNVFGLEMQACDFWAGGNVIVSWTPVDIQSNLLYQNIINNEFLSQSRVEDPDKMIGLLITLNCGDEIMILCEQIVIEETDIDEEELRRVEKEHDKRLKQMFRLYNTSIS